MEMQRIGILEDNVDEFSLDLELEISSDSVAYQRLSISVNYLH